MDFLINQEEDWSERLSLMNNSDKFLFMNRIIIFALSLLALTLSNCGKISRGDTGKSGSQISKQGTVDIVFNEYEHDFGKVTEGEKVAYIFTFKNKGTSDLVVKSATTSCGCTVPKFDKKPISPGGTGKLEVVFDTSGRNGMQTKTISVRSNAYNQVVLLKITAEVINNNNNNNNN
jgi:hypothetical protein